MTIHWSRVALGTVIPFMFTTYDGATGASEEGSGLAVTDIEIYKSGGGLTQRSSDAGYALLDADGHALDSIVGLAGFSVDTGDNTDAGFFAAGGYYIVVVSSVTVDAQTVNFIAGTFSLGPTLTVAGVEEVDVTHWIGAAVATPTVNGVPEVDLTHVAGSTTSVSALATGVATLLADWLNGGRLDLILDIIAADTTTDIPALIAALQAFVDTEVAAILVDTNELQTDWTNGGRLDLLIDAIKAATDNLPSDPADASVIAGRFDTVDTAVADLPTNAELATALGTADDAVLAQVALVKAKTDLIPADPADASDIAALIDALPTAAENVTAMLAAAYEGAETFQDFLRLARAALLGKASGLDTTTAVYRDAADAKDRITATVDVDGNRTAVVLDAT
jgi:hypothetical protein